MFREPSEVGLKEDTRPDQILVPQPGSVEILVEIDL